MTMFKRPSTSSKTTTVMRHSRSRSLEYGSCMVLLLMGSAGWTGCSAERAARSRSAGGDAAAGGRDSSQSDGLDATTGSADSRISMDASELEDASVMRDASHDRDASGARGPVDRREYSVLSTRALNADGVGVGLEAYDLIRAFGGSRPIESPDLYPENHPEVPHIVEAFDTEVGDHFVFSIHRDIDIDRDRIENSDRQRNEIKAYGGSEDALKGYEGETLVYRWMFKINAEMEVSRRFSHFFQLKAVGGSDSQPILTISGAERSGQDGIEIRHSPLRDTTILDRRLWSMVTGQWLVAYCRATYVDSGELRLILVRLRDGEVIFDVDIADLDLWRGEQSDHFVRPKWGIYRSIADPTNLRADEEIVRFARFEVDKVVLE